MSIKQILTKILSRLGTESFTVGRSVGTSGGLWGTLDKSTGTVRVNFYLNNSADVPADTVLFTIPERYRPKETAGGSAMIMTSISGTNFLAYAIQIATNGAVTHNGTNRLRSIMGVAEYKVGGVLSSLKNLFRRGCLLCR